MTARPETRILVKEAEPLLAGEVASLTDEQIVQCFDAYASQISFLNADDYGGDWRLVPKFRPGLDKAKAELDRRGIAAPNGYLI